MNENLKHQDDDGGSYDVASDSAVDKTLFWDLP